MSAAARLRDPEAAGGRRRIARHDLAKLQAEFFREPRGKIHAVRDRMVEPDLDQPLRHRHRDEPLRRLPRHPEFLRHLVLRVAGDVIEPAGARGVIEPGAVGFDLQRLASRSVNAVLHVSARIPASPYPSRSEALPPSHPCCQRPGRPIRPRLSAGAASRKWLPPTNRQTVIPAFRAREQPDLAVLDHQAFCRIGAKGRRRVEKEIGRRLAVAPPSTRRKSCPSKNGSRPVTSSESVARSMLLLVAMQ